MYKKFIIITIGSLVSFFCTFKFTKMLAPFTIKAFDKIDDTLLRVFDIICTNTPQQKSVLINSVVLILSVILSTIMVINLISIINEKILELFPRILVILLIVLLFFNIIVSLYYILFMILVIAVFIAIVFLLSISSGKGGSVYVKGHYRNGSYVRSHTRKSPRRF